MRSLILLPLLSLLSPLPVARPVSTAPQPALAGSNQTFVEIAKSVKPAVVNIYATKSGRGEGSGTAPFDDPLFRKFFGDEFFRKFEHPKERKERGLGSGVIVESNGLIITNNHVVGKADEIRVTLSDKREFKAKLIGTDPKTDVAVVKIDAARASDRSLGRFRRTGSRRVCPGRRESIRTNTDRHLGDRQCPRASRRYCRVRRFHSDGCGHQPGQLRWTLGQCAGRVGQG